MFTALEDDTAKSVSLGTKNTSSATVTQLHTSTEQPLHSANHTLTTLSSPYNATTDNPKKTESFNDTETTASSADVTTVTTQTTENGISETPEAEHVTLSSIVFVKDIDHSYEFFNASNIRPFSTEVNGSHKYLLDRTLKEIRSK
jgi:hypothetical protein